MTEENKRPKRNDVREDGKIFWGFYKKNGKEYQLWTTEERKKQLLLNARNSRKKYYEKNHEKVNEKRRNKTPEQRLAYNAYMSNYRKANPEKIKQIREKGKNK